MKRIIGLLTIVFLAALYSCNNEKVNIPELSEDLTLKSAEISLTEVQVEAATTESEYEVEFFSNAETMLTNWWKIGKHFKWNSKLRYRINHAPNVTIESGDEDGYPKTITLDYGDSTVLRNGKVLSGEIVIEISAHRRSKDYERTITYNDFGVNDLTVNGFSSIEMDKLDSTFRKIESNLEFNVADTMTIARESERVWQWFEGMDTEDDQTDDVIIITGKTEATLSKDGETYEYKREITTPLKKIDDCKFIVEGVVTVSYDGSLLCTIDYGDGTCDEFAIKTDADGVETEINLAEGKMNTPQNGNQKGKQNNNQNGNQNKNQSNKRNG